MKAKVKRGNGFRGVLNYAFGDSKDPEIFGGNLTGNNPQELAAEFGIFREMRPSAKNPVWHCSLSSPSGEVLTADQWRAVTEDFMSIMGMSENPFVFVRHNDTDHDHGHIIASRINLHGELWAGQFEVSKAIRATQQIERDHGLILTPGFIDDADTLPEQMATNIGIRNPTKNEIEQADRTGEAPARLQLQDIIGAALDDDTKTVFAFIDELEAAGVTAVPNVAKTGRMNGFSFEIDGIPFKGSQLGKAFGWKSLQERGIEYEQDRDGPSLVAQADEIKRRITEVSGGEPARTSDQVGPAGDGLIDDQPEIRREPSGDRADARELNSEDRISPSVGLESDEISDGGSLENAGAGEEIPANIAAASDHLGGADLDDVADRIADLAAPVDPSPLESQPVPNVTPAQKAKVRAWEVQSKALGAPEYRLTLTSRKDNLSTFNLGKGKGDAGDELFYKAPDISHLIPYLSRQNLLGYDIYITPIDKSQHFILIDDTTLQQVDEMKAEGFEFALVQESSENNVQAVLKLPRQNEPQEQKAAHRLMVHLNRTWGDANISGVTHPFRMAGFSNKKPGRNNVFTRILDAAGTVCAKASEMLMHGRNRLFKMAQEATNRKAIPIQTPADGDADRRYDSLLKREMALVAREGWKLDERRVDYRIAVAMLDENYTEDAIAGAMERRSPRLEAHHPEFSTYILRTIEAAGRLTGQPNATIEPDF